MTRPTPTRPRIGLALAGGGPLGAIYEIGALCALEEAIDGLDFTECHGYVGVSAGGFIAAGLANGIGPRELCAGFIENTGAADDVFEPALLLRPAWRELAQRLTLLPWAMAEATLRYAFTRAPLASALGRLGRTLPTGLFSNHGVETRLRRQFAAPGRSDDFRRLRRKLVLVATDLDSGESAPFGQPGLDHVPISTAVRASSALPGLFPPVEIDGRFYVDGALKKTLHASVLLDEGLDLLICLNPLVPFDARPAAAAVAGARIPRMVGGGLPTVLSQTFRTLIHSRLELGMRGYERSHPETTILLFEPDHRDARMYLANTFGYAQRRALAEHAYQQTRHLLRARRGVLRRQLAAHGLNLLDAVLDEPRKQLLGSPAAGAPTLATALRRLDEVLDDLGHELETVRT
jgi:predicted acylesterase/phospholipase RssA